MNGYRTTVRPGWLGGFVAVVKFNGQTIMRVTAPTEAKAHQKASRAVTAEEAKYRKHMTKRGWVRGHSVEVD